MHQGDKILAKYWCDAVFGLWKVFQDQVGCCCASYWMQLVGGQQEQVSDVGWGGGLMLDQVQNQAQAPSRAPRVPQKEHQIGHLLWRVQS